MGKYDKMIVQMKFQRWPALVEYTIMSLRLPLLFLFLLDWWLIREGLFKEFIRGESQYHTSRMQSHPVLKNRDVC